MHIALAWLLQKQPVTAPIIGATKITHLEDAVGPALLHDMIGGEADEEPRHA